jgi:hypothetical protein
MNLRLLKELLKFLQFLFYISETEKIKIALEATIAKVAPKFQLYIPQLKGIMHGIY